MEIFLFILSFVSGGVAITVAYNAHTTRKIRKDYDHVVQEQKNLIAVQEEQFHKTESMVKELVANIKSTREAMQADNYKDLSGYNTELDNLKSSIGSLNNNFEEQKRLNGGEVKKIYSDIMSLNNKINKIREDQTLNQNY
tara:strand:+ start:3652 stop:4071 length:420 start_codon:yes stop_codon:yes gene_type:complete